MIPAALELTPKWNTRGRDALADLWPWGPGVRTFDLSSATPSAVAKPLREKKAEDGIAVAVAGFLADLRLEGAQAVLGALAMMLAEAAETAPPYTIPKYAAEFRALLLELRTEERREGARPQDRRETSRA